MGTDNIISAVMHADEINTALTEEYGKPIYHYHLHVVALPVVRKEVKWTKKCKDKSLIGTTKEVINQVSHSNKWKSEQMLDNQGKPVYDKKGNAFAKEKQDELERQRLEQEKIQAERKAREEAKEKAKLEKQKLKDSPEYKKKRRADRDAR